MQPLPGLELRVSTVVSWVRRFEERGSVASGHIGGYKPKSGEAMLPTGMRGSLGGMSGCCDQMSLGAGKSLPHGLNRPLDIVAHITPMGPILRPSASFF